MHCGRIPYLASRVAFATGDELLVVNAKNAVKTTNFDKKGIMNFNERQIIQQAERHLDGWMDNRRWLYVFG